jgi:surface protein
MFLGPLRANYITHSKPNHTQCLPVSHFFFLNFFAISIATNGNLQGAVDLWVSDQAAAAETYGEIGTWDVSSVTNMNRLFSSKGNFNADIFGWDVSSVTDMASMFSEAYAFNQDISGWDVSSVIWMEAMFFDAYAFNQNISGWDVSTVVSMNGMFCQAPLFNQNISAWDVSSVTDMTELFFSATAFNQDISEWDVSSVRDMDFMFYFASSFNQNLCAWGSKLPFPPVFTTSSFQGSGCPAKGDPSFNSTSPGPFCYSCAQGMYLGQHIILFHGPL